MAEDVEKAACRAALLPKAFALPTRDGEWVVPLDDAAACMAERETKLRTEIDLLAGELGAACARNAKYKAALAADWEKP